MEAEITNFQAKPQALNPNDETIMTNDEKNDQARIPKPWPTSVLVIESFEYSLVIMG